MPQQGIDGQPDCRDSLGICGKGNDDLLFPFFGVDAGLLTGEFLTPPGVGNIVEPLAVIQQFFMQGRYGASVFTE